MIRERVRLSEKESSDLNELLEICHEMDKVPVVIQIDKTLNHHQRMNSWFMAYSGETLIGVLSLFGPLRTEAEFTGCVRPEYRKRGVVNSLVDAALKEAGFFGIERILFALDRKSESGQAMMRKKGYLLVQTEYSMVFPKQSMVKKIDSRLRIMRTGIAELDDMAQISASAFDEPLDVTKTMLMNGLKSKERETYAACFEEHMIGVISLMIQDQTAMMNGLAINPLEQGKGYGADFLTQILLMVAERELTASLDVNSENKTAYNLYKRLGFQETEVQDYYEKQ